MKKIIEDSMHEDSLCQLQDGVDHMQHAMQCFLVRLNVTFSGKMSINTFIKRAKTNS